MNPRIKNVWLPIAAAVLLVAGADIFIKMYRESRTTAVPPATDASGERVDGHAGSPGDKQDSGSAIAQRKPPKRVDVGGIASNFSNSENLKDFAAGLQTLADTGNTEAQYFLARTYQDCMLYSVDPQAFFNQPEVQSLNLPKNFSTVDRKKSIERIGRRCAGFGRGDITRAAMDDLYRKAALAGDARGVAHALGVPDVLKTANDRRITQEEIPGLIDSIVISRDPYAIFEMANSMGSSAEGKDSTFGPFAGTDRDMYAWTLVACDLGLPCGIGSSAVGGYCLSTYVCGYGSLEEAIRNGGLSPEEYKIVEDKRYKILDHYFR